VRLSFRRKLLVRDLRNFDSFICLVKPVYSKGMPVEAGEIEGLIDSGSKVCSTPLHVCPIVKSIKFLFININSLEFIDKHAKPYYHIHILCIL